MWVLGVELRSHGKYFSCQATSLPALYPTSHPLQAILFLSLLPGDFSLKRGCAQTLLWRPDFLGFLLRHWCGLVSVLSLLHKGSEAGLLCPLGSASSSTKWEVLNPTYPGGHVRRMGVPPPPGRKHLAFTTVPTSLSSVHQTISRKSECAWLSAGSPSLSLPKWKGVDGAFMRSWKSECGRGSEGHHSTKARTFQREKLRN